MAFNHLSCEQLLQTIQENPSHYTIVDIRDRASFEAGHIEQAMHVDNGNVDTFLMQADKSRPLVVCCYHGNSSQGAANYFHQQGFHQTFSLDGGYEYWKTLV